MAKYNLYVEDVSVEAIFNKLGGVEGARRFLLDELTLSEVVRSYREEDGIIRFTVTSDDTSGANWIKRLEDGSYNVGGYARQVLLSPVSRLQVDQGCHYRDRRHEGFALLE